MEFYIREFSMHLKGTYFLECQSCYSNMEGTASLSGANRMPPAVNSASVCCAAPALSFSSSVSLTAELSDVTAHCPPGMAHGLATPSDALPTAFIPSTGVSVRRVQGAGASRMATCWNRVWRKNALL